MKNIRIYIALAVAGVVALSSCMEENPDEFLAGSWQASEQSQQYGQSSYVVTISEDASDSTKIYISNFYQLGSSERAMAIVNGSQLTIPSQTVSSHQIQGSGTISAANIQITHTANDGSQTDNVTVTYVN